MIPPSAASLALLAAWTGTNLQGGTAIPATPAQASLSVELLVSPAGAWSSQPNLSIDAAGNIHMVWVERTPGTTASIKFSRFDGTRWSTARVIVAASGVRTSSADIPSLIALPGGRLVAHWLQTSSSSARSYGVHVSQSSDSGQTWNAGVVPHSTHETGENGFASLFPQPGDSVGVAWLDGRNFAPGTPAARRETALITTRVGANDVLSRETVLDTRVCDCCQTSYALTARGPVVAYRDRTADEIRDISVVQFVNGAWSAPRSVHNDGWRMASCPVNGPAIAANGNQVAVGWFTAARDTTRVLVAFSGDAAQTFGQPVRVDAGDPLGKVGIVMSQPGTAWVSWMERVAGNTGRLHVRRASSSGATSSIYVFGAPDLTHTSGFPQMVERQGTLYVAWSAAAAGGVPAMVKVGRAVVTGK